MVLHLIGLGLGDEKDITVKGLERVRRCKYVFLEAYTSILGVDRRKLVLFFGDWPIFFFKKMKCSLAAISR